MKKILMTLAACGLSAAGLAAQDFNLEKIGLSAISVQAPEAPEPALEKTAPGAADHAAQKEWTFMVFMNSKNDLERYGLRDMNEMEKVGSTSKVNVVVEMGRMAGYSDSDGDWKGVRRYYVTRDINPFRINSTVAQDLGSVNMGDAKELLNFIKWTKGRYPAKRYALILWNHGSGWLRGNPTDYGSKGISYDEETGNNIDIPQLGRVLAEAGGVDLLASDACLMQMAEVAYEVKDSVSFMVGSEETEPGSGYSYNKILLPLALAPSMVAEDLGRVIVAAYWESHPIGLSRVTTHSLLDLGKAAGLGSRLDAFARAAMASPDKKAIQAARAGAEKYSIAENKDLAHFARLVEKKASDPALKAAARGLASYINESLVLFNMTSILPRGNSNGIAAYIRENSFDWDYARLKLASDTKWDEFLLWQGI